MAAVNILKTDSRGRITLPSAFRSESLFEYVVEGDQLILYPVRTVRKFPDMSDLPGEELSGKWKARELEVNKDNRSGISVDTPSEALKRLRRK